MQFNERKFMLLHKLFLAGAQTKGILGFSLISMLNSAHI